MVLDRRTVLAALILAVVVLAPWPVIDRSPLSLVSFLCGVTLLIVLGLSELAAQRGQEEGEAGNQDGEADEDRREPRWSS
jgi:heme A synthase